MPARQLGAGRLLVAALTAAAVTAVAAPVSAAPAGAVPGTVGDRDTVAAAAGPAGLRVIVDERGRISRSVDAVGTLDGSGTVTVTKPAGGTVRRAVLLAASTGLRGPARGEVALAGTVVPLGNPVETSIRSVNYWTDVTALLTPLLAAAPAGATELPVTESDPASVDGVILAVVFDDPAQTRVRSTTLLHGATQTTGDRLRLTLSEPVDPAAAGTVLEMSLGISFGYQSDRRQQYSQVDVNGARLTTSAGGEDDGEPDDGGLVTVGGVGDTPANPDPTVTPSAPRDDDELYDLRPFVAAGATTVEVDTLNPPGDDNILFAEFTADPPVTRVVTPNPAPDQRMVALGDSFSAGEGTGAYDPDRPGAACHRGPAAWPRLLERRVAAIVSLDHRACAGATVGDLGARHRLSGPQVLPAAPDPEVDLVTLTVGAEDVGLRGLLAGCGAPVATCADDPDTAGFRGRLRTLGPSLDALYRKVEAAYPNAQVVHVGYPRLTPSPGVPPVRCGWLGPAEQVAGARLVRLLNDTIEAAAGRRPRVEYLDATAVLRGHELCTADPWVVPVGFSLAGEQAHPTAPGQVAYAARVAYELGYPFPPAA